MVYQSHEVLNLAYTKFRGPSVKGYQTHSCCDTTYDSIQSTRATTAMQSFVPRLNKRDSALNRINGEAQKFLTIHNFKDDRFRVELQIPKGANSQYIALWTGKYQNPVVYISMM